MIIDSSRLKLLPTKMFFISSYTARRVVSNQVKLKVPICCQSCLRPMLRENVWWSQKTSLNHSDEKKDVLLLSCLSVRIAKANTTKLTCSSIALRRPHSYPACS